MGGKFRPHRDSILDRPARSQSLYQLSYPAHIPRVKVNGIKYLLFLYAFTESEWGEKKTFPPRPWNLYFVENFILFYFILLKNNLSGIYLKFYD